MKLNVFCGDCPFNSPSEIEPPCQLVFKIVPKLNSTFEDET